MEMSTGKLEGAEHRQLEEPRSHEVYGQPRAPDQLNLRETPDELDGTPIHEMADGK